MKKPSSPAAPDRRRAVLEGVPAQPPQDALLAAYAKGVALGFKRGLTAAKKGQAQTPVRATDGLPVYSKPARPLLTPTELSMLSWLRDRQRAD